MKKKRLLIYFCISLALLTLLGVSFFLLRKLNALEKNGERVDHSYQVIIQTNMLEQDLLNAETSQRGYLLTENAGFLQSYLDELKGLPEIFVQLDTLTADNPQQQRNLDTLREVINLQLKVLKDNMEQGLGDTLGVMEGFIQSDAYMDKIRSVIDHLKSNESYLLNARNYDKNKNAHESKRNGYISLIIAFALCGVASVTIIWFFNSNEIYRNQLEDKLQELTTLNSEIRELGIASAHNLQEPMRKVQMIIDRLQYIEGVKDPQLNEQLTRVKDIYNRQQLVNKKIVEYYDILLDKGQRQRIDLAAFIQGLQQKYNWAAQLHLKVEPLKSIEANPQQLELLFTNLIHNAIQFRAADRPLIVHIHEEQLRDGFMHLPGLLGGKSYYCIAVSDNGPGVKKEYLHKIFDLFQKLDNSDGNALQSGMGLSFCKRIMLNHGGFITARNNSPHGLGILLFFPQNA